MNIRRVMIATISAMALLTGGAIAAPAAQANGYSKAENRYWVANIEWDRKAARHGGKRLTVKSGKEICREFDKYNVEDIMWGFMGAAMRDTKRRDIDKKWAIQTALLAPMFLCPRHLDDMDDFVDEWLDWADQQAYQ